MAIPIWPTKMQIVIRCWMIMLVLLDIFGVTDYECELTICGICGKLKNKKMVKPKWPTKNLIQM